jgi:hypothetical protein
LPEKIASTSSIFIFHAIAAAAVASTAAPPHFVPIAAPLGGFSRVFAERKKQKNHLEY